MRDRLIEILGDFPTFGGTTLKQTWMPEAVEKLASHLLAEGVIVPPCKVGDTVYRVKKRYGTWCILPRSVVSITYRLDHLYRPMFEIFSTETDVLGKTVFLTRELAEEALERSENGT